MAGPDGTTGSAARIADRWLGLPLALRTSLLCFAVVAMSGIMVVVMGGGASADSSDGDQVPTISRAIIPVLLAAFIAGLVAARRGFRAWLAGYAGAVLGGVPISVAHEVMATDASATDLLVGGAWALLVFAPLVGLAFMAAGGLTLGARRFTSSSDVPQPRN